MHKKSKPITRLMMKENFPKPVQFITDEEKHFIIQEYLSSGCTKVDIWRKYTGQKSEHGSLLKWMRKLGYNTDITYRSINLIQNSNIMSNKDIDFELLQLKNRIADLEKKLKEADMKAIAYSTMVDLAEKEYKIPIRKKLDTKLSK